MCRCPACLAAQLVHDGRTVASPAATATATTTDIARSSSPADSTAPYPMSDEPVWEPFGEPVDGLPSAMGGTVVHDPEHPPGGCVGLAGHDLFDQGCERFDAG